MAVRAGIDLVDVADVNEALERWGERYLARVFTPSEVASCGAPGDRRRGERLAACLAAKEAAFKVFLKADDEMPWQCVELTRQATGGLALHLSGTALACAEREGISSLAVSVSWKQDHAMAVVLAEIGVPHDPANSEDTEGA